jgi:hypothetical protein
MKIMILGYIPQKMQDRLYFLEVETGSKLLKEYLN